MSNSTRLYDHAGQPLGQNRDDAEGNLPAGVQALIESRVNSAIADMREHNRDDLQDLARDHVRKWRYLAFLTTAFGVIGSIIAIITTFYAPEKIGKWVSSQVDLKLTEPLLKESADRVIAGKMSDYVDERLHPLRDKAASLEVSVDNVRKDIENKQGELEQQQTELSKQLKIAELAVAAKAGSRASYNRLLSLARDGTEQTDLLKASLKEIELFFDADRGQLSFQILVKKSTMKGPGYSVDEVVHILRTQPDLAEAAINVLGTLKSKASVKELCAFIENTDDLRAAARATRALQIITDERFRPLEFEKVANWWTENSANKIYSGSYDGYLSVVQDMWHGPVDAQRLERFVKQLTATCESDPNTLHAHCLKAGFLLILGQDEEANSILEEVQKKNDKYRWLLVWKAAERVKKGNMAEGVSLLNQAFSVSPDSELEQTVNWWNIFLPIRGNADVHWPSKTSGGSKIKDMPDETKESGS